MITKNPSWMLPLFAASFAAFFFVQAGYEFAKDSSKYLVPAVFLIGGILLLFCSYGVAITYDYEYDSIVEDEINERVEAKLKQIRDAL